MAATSFAILRSRLCLRLTLMRIRSAWYSSTPKEASEKKPARIINVAIIGAPNSGKSTLINKIVGRKICAASNKVHTTTKMVRAMTYQNDTQIIFLDTPGIVTEKEQKKYKLPPSMIGACHKGIRCANVVGVVHDVSNKFMKNSLHRDVTTLLELAEDIPSFLILNKVDVLKSKKQLLTTIHQLTNGVIAGNPIPGLKKGEKKKELHGFSKFSDVFLVSALNGDGVEDVKQYLINNAKLAYYQYSPDEWTDQSPETLVVEAVRAKFLDFLSQEIPYSLKTQLEYFEDNEEKIVCYVTVECPSERLVRLISGAGGGRLQQIKSNVRSDLMDIFQKMVTIDIQLTVSKKSE